MKDWTYLIATALAGAAVLLTLGQLVMGL